MHPSRCAQGPGIGASRSSPIPKSERQRPHRRDGLPRITRLAANLPAISCARHQAFLTAVRMRNANRSRHRRRCRVLRMVRGHIQQNLVLALMQIYSDLFAIERSPSLVVPRYVAIHASRIDTANIDMKTRSLQPLMQNEMIAKLSLRLRRHVHRIHLRKPHPANSHPSRVSLRSSSRVIHCAFQSVARINPVSNQAGVDALCAPFVSHVITFHT